MVAVVTYPTQQIGEVLLLVVVGVALFFAPELYVEVGRLRLLHSQSSVCGYMLSSRCSSCCWGLLRSN